MADEAVTQESLEFRAEVQQLLNILAHSLYTEREIFLRELISNASDALNRMQFELLTNRDVHDAEAELAIWLEFDDQAHTLRVLDSGVGMTREELIENLGTIAHSGALAFLKSLQEGQRPADIIGQFGVGFYSVFMVAEQVTVTTRSYRKDATAWRWTSDGGSRYDLAPATKESRGTAVEIKLKEDAYEFASAWRLEQIVKRHSNFVSFPIYLESKVVNQRTAPWRKPLSEVQAGEYDEFYQQLTFDADPPLAHVHIITDAPVEIRAILYVPRHFDRSEANWRADYGPRLYSRKVLIQEHGKELLPEYLRFVEGVVDSEDLPLNISRETVQSNRVLRQMQKVLTSRVLKALRELAQERPDDYKTFWEQFGPFVKQGTAMSMGDQGDLVPLLRFYTSKSDGNLVSLADYAASMAPEQKAIYYILATDRASAASSPHLDPLQARGLEVLYLLDPFDGFMVQSLREHDGKPFKNVDDPALDLPPMPEKEEKADEARDEATEAADLAPVLERFKQVLGDRVSDVRATNVLTDSPCRLVSTGSGAERDLERVRRLLEQDYKALPKVLELNPRHVIVRNLEKLLAGEQGSAKLSTSKGAGELGPAEPAASGGAEAPGRGRLVDAVIEQLYANMLLLEGLYQNPSDMVPRLQELLEAATRR